MSMRVRQIRNFVYIYIYIYIYIKNVGVVLSVQAIDTHLPPHTAFERSYLMTGFYCCWSRKVCKYIPLSVADRHHFARTIFTNQSRNTVFLKVEFAPIFKQMCNIF